MSTQTYTLYPPFSTGIFIYFCVISPLITYTFCLYKMSHFHLTQLSNPLFTISLPPVGLEIIPICLRRELGTWLRYEIRWGVLFVCESGNTFCVKFEVLSSGTKALVSCVQLENWIGSWWFHWHIWISDRWRRAIWEEEWELASVLYVTGRVGRLSWMSSQRSRLLSYKWLPLWNNA